MKKFLSVSMILVLSLAVLVGCGGEDQSNAKEDVVTTASIVNEEDAFKEAISKDGKWIIATLDDLKFDEELVVEGEFRNKGDADKELYRKIAPYTQDENRNVTERYTITAPKLTIKSPNTKLQGGTFVGDVYVEAKGFTIKDAKVEGNVYFANEDYKASADMSNKGEVTGVTEVKGESDVVTTASLVNEEAAFKNAISEDGTWIIATLSDLTFDEELIVEGEFRNKGDASKDLYRKIAPYTQDDNYNVTERYTITAPKLTIKSPNTKFQGGIFEGDIYVEANGFVLKDAKVKGNVYFANEDYKASADMSNKGEVTGVTEVKGESDVVTTASLVNEEAAFKNAISEDGTWIIATLSDLTFDEELIVEGEFRNKGDASKDLYRKIAPYTQDDNYNVTERYTITAPKLTIKSPNTKFQGGIFEGDIYVEANGFVLKDAKVKGNVYFANKEYKASADMSNKVEVTGVTEVK